MFWSTTILDQLPQSITKHSILTVQFTCLTVFFAQPLSKSSLAYLLVWNPPLQIPYISSPNHCPLFATHAHTIVTCFAVIPKLWYLFLVSFSTLYTEYTYRYLTILISAHWSAISFSFCKMVVCVCVMLGEEMYGVWSWRCQAKRMADCTTPVVKLTLTLTGHNQAKTGTSPWNGTIVRQNEAYWAIFCTLKTTSGFIFLLPVVWSDLATNRKWSLNQYDL